jgi:hypothetical protein
MGGRGKAFSAVAAGFSVYFAFAAAVQLNDPDAFAWGGFYLAAAALSVIAIRRPVPVALATGFALISAAWAAILAPVAFSSSFRELFQSWQMMSAGMEAGREFLGLLILVVWMLALIRDAKRQNPA